MPRHFRPPADAELAPGKTTELIRERSVPLNGSRDLDPLVERIGDARFVLLGEATHGTSEFYTWRAEISRRLILEKGFDFIAVEGDWPACDRVDRYICDGHDGDGTDPREVLQAFDRWPTWMWANEEIAQFIDWLRRHNEGQHDRKVGFHGLDVYSLWESLYSVLGYLRKNHPEALDSARSALRCFEPYGEDVQEYARTTARFVPHTCEDEVIELLAELRRRPQPDRAQDRDRAFRAEQNGHVIRNAERYYRTMVGGGPESWNIRDRHMMETLRRLADHYGDRSRAIVWEHNTHIGDARFTDMAEDNMVNVGQLAREQLGAEGVVLVGFATHRGSVIAGRAWDAPAERMTVPPGREDSWEDLLHRAANEDKLVFFRGESEPDTLLRARGHRAIGVVYRPEYEQFGNYVPTVLPRRYDALVYIDETRALRPIPVAADLDKVPETFPSGR